MSHRILVVDDEQIIRESLSFILSKEGFEVDEAANGAEALAKQDSKPYDLVITDIEMPEMRGMDLLEHIAKHTPETFVIIITAFGSVETAVQALRKGAYDYVLKPIDFDDILHRVRKLLDHRALAHEITFLRKELNRSYDFEQIIGQSPSMKKMYQVIQRVAVSDGTVLITGKSGTGKELVARAIYANGKRRNRRFVPINCGAIVDTLFESELFGHKKGSFTGAIADKEGLLKVADGGTVFLDEVSEIPLHLQVKLLRAIEQKEITPVGMTDSFKIDVRFIAATNRDLRLEVEAGKFRDDLFYRLNVVEIDIPNLSERHEDIPLLAQHFLENFRNQMGRPIKGFSNEAMQAILRHTWKGEVRELENIVERAVIFCDSDMIQLEHLPENIRPAGSVSSFSIPTGKKSLKDAVKEFERHYILEVLGSKDGNKEAVAEELSISLSSLYRKMDELGIPTK